MADHTAAMTGSDRKSNEAPEEHTQHQQASSPTPDGITDPSQLHLEHRTRRISVPALRNLLHETSINNGVPPEVFLSYANEIKNMFHTQILDMERIIGHAEGLEEEIGVIKEELKETKEMLQTTKTALSIMEDNNKALLTQQQCLTNDMGNLTQQLTKLRSNQVRETTEAKPRKKSPRSRTSPFFPADFKTDGRDVHDRSLSVGLQAAEGQELSDSSDSSSNYDSDELPNLLNVTMHSKRRNQGKARHSRSRNSSAGKATVKLKDPEYFHDNGETEGPLFKDWEIEVMYRLEHGVYNNEGERILWLYGLTKGEAKKLLAPRMSPNNPHKFSKAEQLLSHLRSNYFNTMDKELAEDAFLALRQGVTETFRQFKSRFDILAQESELPVNQYRKSLWRKINGNLMKVLVTTQRLYPDYSTLADACLQADTDLRRAHDREQEEINSKRKYTAKQVAFRNSISPVRTSDTHTENRPGILKTSATGRTYAPSSGQTSPGRPNSERTCRRCNKVGHIEWQCDLKDKRIDVTSIEGHDLDGEVEIQELSGIEGFESDVSAHDGQKKGFPRA